MGRIKKDNRIKTNILINEAPLCKVCPAKIYQKDDDHLKYGKGNIFPTYVFVLPPEAIKNGHCEEYLRMITNNIIDLNTEYITYHPKCTVGSPVEGYANYCRHYLLHELMKLKPKKVFFFGVDIPDEIQQFDGINFKVYKMNNLLSIYYGKEKLTDFIIKMKQLL